MISKAQIKVAVVVLIVLAALMFATRSGLSNITKYFIPVG